MRTEIYSHLAPVLLLMDCTLLTTVAFNLDTSAEHREILSSPSLTDQRPSADRISKILPTPKNNPSYFGYSLALRNLSSANGFNARMIIGSPMETTKTGRGVHVGKDNRPQGGIYTCDITRDSFSNRDPFDRPLTCQSASPPGRQPGDQYGFSVAANPAGKMTACSTTQGQDCGSVIYVPGVCYRTADFGQTWSKDRRSRNTGCHLDTVDVMFVLDGSQSVLGHFHKIKDFVKNITALLDIEKGTIHVGVVQYSTYIWRSSRPHKRNYVKTEIELGQYKTYEEFEDALLKVNISAGGTMTGAALRKVVEDFTQSERYRASNNKQVMILLTDGQNAGNVVLSSEAKAELRRQILGGGARFGYLVRKRIESTGVILFPISKLRRALLSQYSKRVEQYAAELRDIGVTPYAVGVGPEIDSYELRMIANGNKSTERVYTVGNFEGLNDIVYDLQSEILSFQLEASHTSANASFGLQLGQIGFSSHYGETAIQINSTAGVQPDRFAASPSIPLGRKWRRWMLDIYLKVYCEQEKGRPLPVASIPRVPVSKFFNCDGTCFTYKAYDQTLQDENDHDHAVAL